jgi:formate hydrogenlyase subunit 3/multisubunit Na+/H+ antiporter MnhD subunit
LAVVIWLYSKQEKSIAMKLLLLIPNFVLMAIAGFNLANEFSKTGEPNYILFKLLHFSVLIISLACTVTIVRSLFTIRYVEVPQERSEAIEEYNEIELQHT